MIGVGHTNKMSLNLNFNFQNLNDPWIRYVLANNLVVLISIGLLFDKHTFIYPGIIELARCVIYVYFTHKMDLDNLIDYLTYYVYAFHLFLIWIPYFVYQIYAFVYTLVYGRVRVVEDRKEED